ncbi:MAG: hypothetical protein AB7O56_05765 [Bauldia sp.]
MLFRTETLEGIAAGRVTMAFRRWRRPTVKPGGALRTAIGVLAIDEVAVVEPADVTDADARRAGFPDRGALLADLPGKDDARLYRVTFQLAGPDPRLALRNDAGLGRNQLAAVRVALAKLDRLMGRDGWSLDMLRRIGDAPGRRAADIASAIGMEKLDMKRRIRVLKEHGLTESLEVGYRLTPRGKAALDALTGQSRPA